MSGHGVRLKRNKEVKKMNKSKSTATVKKIGVKFASAALAAKDSGGVKERAFNVAIYYTDGTYKDAGAHFYNEIGSLNCTGERAKAAALARLTKVFTRRTAAILAARDIAEMFKFKLADSIVEEVAAAEETEKPYIEREAERAKARAEKSAARKAEREAAKIAANEDKILKAAAEIQARRNASKAAA